MHRVTFRRRAIAVFGAVALLGGGLAACGDDDDDDGAATTPANVEFTNDPITVFFQAPIGTPVSDNGDAAEVVKNYAAKLNAVGGINGSEIKIETCSDADANSEAECVRKAQDAKAVAFVGSAFLYNPEAGLDGLEKAKIANIAPLALQIFEYSKPINFPIYSTSLSLLACPQQLVDGTGAKKVSAIAQDLPVQKELLQTIQGVSAALKVPYGRNVTVPIKQADLSGPVKQLADADSDGVVNVLAPTSQAAFATAGRSLGEQIPAICAAPSNYTLEVLNQLGADADNVHLSTGLPIDKASAESLPLVKEFTALADGVELKSPGNAFNAFMGLYVLGQAAKTIEGKQLTGKNVLAAMNKLTVDLTGAGLPPIDFSKPVPAPGFERFFNPVTNLYKWDSGEKGFVKTDAKPVNILETLAALQKAKG